MPKVSNEVKYGRSTIKINQGSLLNFTSELLDLPINQEDDLSRLKIDLQTSKTRVIGKNQKPGGAIAKPQKKIQMISEHSEETSVEDCHEVPNLKIGNQLSSEVMTNINMNA